MAAFGRVMIEIQLGNSVLGEAGGAVEKVSRLQGGAMGTRMESLHRELVEHTVGNALLFLPSPWIAENMGL